MTAPVAAGLPLSENFAGLGTSATATLPADFKVDKNTTVRTVGTYAAATAATENVDGANVATNATNGIYNFGSGTTDTGPDRAVGFLSSGTATKSGNLYVQLVNNSGANYSGLKISYDVEKYRNGSNPAGYSIQMYYSTDGSNWTSAGANFLTSFAADVDNSGFSPAPGSTTPVTNKILSQAVNSGADFYLAWNYSVTSGSLTTNAQALAIDNVSIVGTNTIGGTVFTTNSAGTMPAGRTITLLKNGSVAGSGITDSGGNYSIPGLTLASGDKIAVFIDNATTEKGATVTLSGTSDITNLNIIQNQLIVRTDNGGAISNTNLGLAQGVSPDTDLTAIYTVASGNLTTPPGVSLQIWLSSSYQPAGDITDGGDWTNNGTFTAGSNTVTFDSSVGNQTIGGTNNSLFDHLTINNVPVNPTPSTNNVVSLAVSTTVSTALNVTAGVFNQGASASDDFDVTTNSVTVGANGTWQNLGKGNVTLTGNVSNAGQIIFNANGTPCGGDDDILIRSLPDGTKRTWSGAGTFSMTDVDVKDQKVPGALTLPLQIIVNNGTDAAGGGTNTGWTFTNTCNGPYTWIGGASQDWQVPSNWSPVRPSAVANSPGTTDELIFDSDVTPAPTVVNVPTQTIATLHLINGPINGQTVSVMLNAATTPTTTQTLTISGATANDLLVPAGASLYFQGTGGVLKMQLGSSSTAKIDGNVILQDKAHRLLGGGASTVLFQTGSSFATSGVGFVGNPFGDGGAGGGTLGSIIFRNGSTANFDGGCTSPFGAAGPNSVVDFQSGSTQHLFVASAFESSGRSYGNLILDGGSTYDASGSGELFCQNNLTIASGSKLTLSPTSGGNLIVNGDFTNSGAFDAKTRTVKFQGGGATQNINGIVTCFDLLISKIGGSVKVGGDLTINGVLQFNGATDLLDIANHDVTLNGTVAGAGALDSTVYGSDLHFGGMGAVGTVRYLGTQPLGFLTVNRITNGSVTFATNVTVGNALSGGLDLSNGIVDMGANTLSLAAYPQITRTNGYVIGNLQKTFGATGPFVFTLGTENGYSPVDANVTAGSGQSLTVKAVQAKQPNITGTNALQRYWAISNPGAVTANLTFHYLAGDVPGSATESTFKFFKYNGSFTQLDPDVLNTSSHFATRNAVSSFSDWTLAEPAAVYNDAPVNSVPGTQTTDEDTDKTFSTGGGNAIQISDADAGGASVRVTLNGTNGVITLAGTAGLSFTQGDGTLDPTMTFTGSITNINNALNGLTFKPNANFNGAASLQIITNDQGNTGVDPGLTGDANSEEDNDTVNITVTAVNDAPVNTVPGAQVTNEDTPLVFSTGGGNRISISDIDAGSNDVQVTLTGANGAITLNGITGLAFTQGDGTLDPQMTFKGSMTAINNALNGLTFTPAADFNGAASLQITTNDRGNYGADPGLTGDANSEEDSDSVSITVNAVNDPNVTVTVSPSSVLEDGATNLEYTFARDDTNGSLRVNFAVSGDAIFNTDYTVSGAGGFGSTQGFVDFANGEATKTITIDPTADAIVETSETVTLTVTDTVFYNVGSPSFATGTITNDDVAPPEIDVQGNGNSIADGSTAPQTSDGTDFGTVSLGNALTHSFVILNTGAGTLNLSGTPKVDITGPNAGDFVVAAQPSSTVAASSNTTFTIQFAPSAAGLRTATVSIANDDANENPYDFSIQGTGVDPACATPPSGMVAWWPGDGNPDDIKGPTLENGTLQGGATFASGKVGQSFSLDGVNDLVNVPDASALHLQTFTIDAWVNSTQPFTNDEAIVTKSTLSASTGNEFAYGLRVLSGGQAEGRITDAAGATAIVVSASALSANQFYHLALRYDGAALTLYVNGVLDGTTATTLVPDPNTNPVTIGAWQSVSAGVTEYWPGLIDEVEVFNTALDPSDIAAIYNASFMGKCRYTITASAGANGSISPSGTVTVVEGDNQTFNITPDSGYHIADVLVDTVSVGAVSSHTFTNVTANHTIEASFAINTYAITASAGANGSIDPSGAVSVNSGGDQVFNITPDSGYHIADVLVDTVSVGAVSSHTFTNVTANHTIEASFAINTYAITASAGANGSISPSGTVTVNEGDSQSFNITPDSGYHIADVLVDTVSVGAVSSYSFTNVTANHTISASFTVNSCPPPLIVNNTGDDSDINHGDGICETGAGNGVCTLRAAIEEANAAPNSCGTLNINFDSIVFATPGPYEISLSNALPAIQHNVNINGPGADVLTINGEDNRVFAVDSGFIVSISGLTLTGGYASDEPGGAILNDGGTVTVNYCVLTGNTADDDGGAIYTNGGSLTLNNCTIEDNDTTNGYGGGIANRGGGTLTLNNSTVSGNSADSGGGGGIDNGGSGRRTVANSMLTLTNSTISGNFAGHAGGGIRSRGILILTNSTVSCNLANNNGGGIHSDSGTSTINNSTIANNVAGFDCDNEGGDCSGGGIFNNGSTVTLRNTIVAGNFNADSNTSDDVSGAVDASSSSNLIGDGTNMSGITDADGNHNQVGSSGSPIDPGLGPLADNGGPTQTHALLIGSPAIDKGDNCFVDNTCSGGVLLTTDQRGSGFTRKADGNGDSSATVDIGAFEVQTFVVNTTVDTDDVCTSDPGGCSLREAINAANASGGGRITFDIPFDDGHHYYYAADVGDGVSLDHVTPVPNTATTDDEILGKDPQWPHSWWSIQIESGLPEIEGNVLIDGYSQQGAKVNPNPLANGDDAILRIEINGTNDSDGIGLEVCGFGGSTVQGLAINRFTSQQVWIVSDGNTIQGNFIGTDVSGTLGFDFPEDCPDGIRLDDASYNDIGGGDPAQRNVISGNCDNGIFLNSSLDSVGQRADRGNGNKPRPAAKPNTAVKTNSAGRTNPATPNKSGSARASQTSELSSFFSSSNNNIEGNYIGTDRTGTQALGNEIGIQDLGGSCNMIGCTVPEEGNLISGNNDDGILITDTNAFYNTIQGNFIGTKANGVAALGNDGAGVAIYDAVKTVIGRTMNDSGLANTIAFNTGAGVAIETGSFNPGTGNIIRRNSIYSNGGLGIDLVPELNNTQAVKTESASNLGNTDSDGVTANDDKDPDTGANNLQNFPIITSATAGSGQAGRARQGAARRSDSITSGDGSSISGSLNSTPNQTFKIDFYSNTECNAAPPNNYGEGKTWIGSMVTDSTDSGGNVSFVFNPASLNVGDIITATATDGNGNTSEFSKCFEVPSANDFSISASPSSLSIPLSTSDHATISTAVVSGSAETINLSVSGAPSGVTASLSPNSVTAGANSTLNVVVSSSAAAGTYTLTVTGTSASATHNTPVQLTVTNNDFSISASPSSLSIPLGTSDHSTISTAVVSGSAETINLSVSGAPSGVTASLSPNSVTAGSNSTLNVVVSSSAATGPYTLTVTGTSASATHNTPVQLAVTAPLISGHVDYCISPSADVPGVTINVSGSQTTSTTTNSSGNYSINLVAGGNYTLTPTKTALFPTAPGIDTADVIAAQHHFLGFTTLNGCALTAADADGDSTVDTVDPLAIQRFFLGHNSGTGHVGEWRFNPANRPYSNLTTSQSSQNYDALVIGDITGDLTPSLANPESGTSAAALSITPSSVAIVSLPVGNIGTNVTDFTLPVTTSNINASDNLVGFQGDFTFDSSVVTFQVPPPSTRKPASPAGLTAINPGDWNVSANILGAGTIKTLRISAFSTTSTPLSGSGTLFNLNFTRVSNTVGASTPLTWASSPNNFVFIDTNLVKQAPGSTPPGSITIVGPTATNGNVSGQIVDSNGNPVEGAAVRMSGTQNRLTVTDANGRYNFDEVETNGFYTVTPSRSNFSFSPSQRSFSALGQHTDAAFNASATGTALNPLDATEYFVRQQYVDFLGREPDEAGLNFWINNIESCGADQNCRATKHIDTSAAFFLSIEFQQTGYLAYRTYQAAYGDMPGAPVPITLGEFKPDTAEIGNGVVVNKSGWETLLENNKRAFVAEFVQRPRFATAYPTTMTPTEFVAKLFANAGVAPSANDQMEAISEFGSSSTSSDVAARGRALRRVAENSALARQEFNQAFVLMQYFGYLRRNANASPDADFTGYSFWLDKLNAFNGNFGDAEMVKAFLISGEYRGRFPR
ncbi:MAG TPA: LamG-like jellyroll fold domain-containing protein [Pyrinomonadaceae bacterium]|nr:LamG-like jellyroll fold domain-containing protein [Pyrinomonadaceae bacterium]